MRYWHVTHYVSYARVHIRRITDYPAKYWYILSNNFVHLTNYDVVLVIRSIVQKDWDFQITSHHHRQFNTNVSYYCYETNKAFYDDMFTFCSKSKCFI